MDKMKKYAIVLLCCLVAACGTFMLSACGDTYKVTFDLNYIDATGAPAAQSVAAGAKAEKPADPTRGGYTFTGWYEDKACLTEYKFDKEVTGDLTLYAGWREGAGGDTAGEYIMEAENIDLSYVKGGDTSASPEGASLIQSSAQAHGGKYIRSLYVTGLFIEFEFEAAAADDNATLSFRFGGEFKAFTFNNDEIQIYVNPTLNEADYLPTDASERLLYDEIGIPMTGAFAEYKIADGVHIKQGTNTVYLLVNNDDSLYPTASTMNAKAPTIDYLKIASSATLTQKVYSNT